MRIVNLVESSVHRICKSLGTFYQFSTKSPKTIMYHFTSVLMRCHGHVAKWSIMVMGTLSGLGENSLFSSLIYRDPAGLRRQKSTIFYTIILISSWPKHLRRTTKNLLLSVNNVHIYIK